MSGRMVFGSASNRLTMIRDSIVGLPGTSQTVITNDVAGNRLTEIKIVGTTRVDTMVWQYDVLSRTIGSARWRPSPVGVINHFNECHWDGAWRASQPCRTS